MSFGLGRRLKFLRECNSFVTYSINIQDVYVCCRGQVCPECMVWISGLRRNLISLLEGELLVTLVYLLIYAYRYIK